MTVFLTSKYQNFKALPSFHHLVALWENKFGKNPNRLIDIYMTGIAVVRNAIDKVSMADILRYQKYVV